MKIDDDSSDDGLCDGDSSSKKNSNLNFQKRRVRRFLKGFKKVQKEFKCGSCDRGLWGAVFYNKNVTIITKFVTNIALVRESEV